MIILDNTRVFYDMVIDLWELLDHINNISIVCKFQNHVNNVFTAGFPHYFEKVVSCTMFFLCVFVFLNVCQLFSVGYYIDLRPSTQCVCMHFCSSPLEVAASLTVCTHSLS